VCVVIAMLFAGDTTGIPLDQYIAACFVFAMLGLISSFVYFLREIFIASRFMRMQHQQIMLMQPPPPPSPQA